MEHAIKIWTDVIAWVTGCFVQILESIDAWPVYVLTVVIFSAIGALVVPAFHGRLRSDLSDHKTKESK